MFKTIIFSLNAIKLLDAGNKSFRNGYTTYNFLDDNFRSNLENISACLYRQWNWTLQIYIRTLSFNQIYWGFVMNKVQIISIRPFFHWHSLRTTISRVMAKVNNQFSSTTLSIVRSPIMNGVIFLFFLSFLNKT